jgi:adenine-specific DNA-methyltransferase
MNYIGSKYGLLKHIAAILDANGVPTEGIALDLFAGTAAVGQLLKRRGHITYANDWQHYSYVTSVAFLEYNTTPRFCRLRADQRWGARIAEAPDSAAIETYSIGDRVPLPNDRAATRVLQYLDDLTGTAGTFYDTYCAGGSAGRIYYSRENGRRIQAIRDTIEAWEADRLISRKEKAWLIASLIESADRVANTASVYGAYLKHVKVCARKPLQLVAIQPAPSPYPSRSHRAYCEDGISLLRRLAKTPLTLVYVDPPYNHRQYASNYHVLETIARWDLDRFEPRGVAGLRPAFDLRSDFCLRTRVYDAFRQIFELANTSWVLVSYNDEGLLSRRELQALFRESCQSVVFEEIPYKRFRADVDHENRNYKRDHTSEFLILGRLSS